MPSIISAGTSLGTSLNLSGDTSGVLQLQTNGTTPALTIDTSQNVGIGTSSPSTKLDVAGDSQFGTSSTNGARTRYFNQNSQLFVGIDNNAGSNTGIANAPYFLGIGAYPMTFWTNTLERMRIDSSGNLAVGTTTALNTASGRANITLNGSSSSIFVLGVAGAQAGYFFNDGTNGQVANEGSGYLNFRTNGSERMRIDSSGNLLVGKTSSSSYPVQAKGGGLDGSTTVSVSGGVTTTIYTSPQSVTAMFCVVFGDNGSVGFCDLIIFLPGVTPTVVSSNSIYGSPAARTYSFASTTQLRVNVANNLSVRVAVLGTCNV